ncbi:prepilin-type N-terminal cleavage/methylation domain-containing protein, partial [uncultured Ruminobacter sp.]
MKKTKGFTLIELMI